jgi:hypothetical protein
LGFRHGREGRKREKREESQITRKITPAGWATRAHYKYL